MASKGTRQHHKGQKKRKQSTRRDGNDLRSSSEASAHILRPGDPNWPVATSMHVRQQLKQALASGFPDALQQALEESDRMGFKPFSIKFDSPQGMGNEDIAEQILRLNSPAMFEKLLDWACARIDSDPAQAGFALDALFACVERDQLESRDARHEVAAIRRLLQSAFKKGFEILAFDRGPHATAMFAALSAEAAANRDAEAIAQVTATPQSPSKNSRL